MKCPSIRFALWVRWIGLALLFTAEITLALAVARELLAAGSF